MSREFYVHCTPYAYQIRTKLPSIANHLRRLLRLKVSDSSDDIPKVESSRSIIDNELSTLADTTDTHINPILETSSASSSDDNQSREDRAREPWPQTHAVTERKSSELSDSTANTSSEVDPVEPPTSGTNTSYSTSEFFSTLTTQGTVSEMRSASFQTETTQVIVNSLIVSEVTGFMNFVDSLSNSNVHPDYLELPSRRIFRLRMLEEDFRDEVLQNVPLILVHDDEVVDFDRGNDIAVDSDLSGWTTIDSSDISSVAGQSEQPETRNQRVGQDDPPEAIHALLRTQCGSSGGSTEGAVVSVGSGVGGGSNSGGSGGVGGGGGGMDCMPLRPGPFHYLISEQAKSLVALQELQNEVGALLEFRDLVIETFPNLRQKMAATASAGASVMSSSCAPNSHIPLPLSSPSSRRISEWEPGKVRRRVPRETAGSSSNGGESSSSSLPRSRSNSHSGGGGGSGLKNNCSATVQDSGFSTETSSKDSASTAIQPRPSSPRPAILDEAEDELWNLLDVIHRKGIRLREEVECLQGRLESVATEDLASDDVLEAVCKVDTERSSTITGTTGSPTAEKTDGPDKDSQVLALRREKELLLDKVAELEAETISSRARAQELQTELAALSALKTGLEDRLRAGLNNTSSDILVPGAQRLQPITPVAPVVSSPKSNSVSNIKSKSSAFASVGSSGKSHKSRFRTRTIEKNVLLDVSARKDELRDIDVEANVNARRARLGALDSVLVSPMRVAHVKDVDSKKIAAILGENSPLELQRHLITTTVHNQVLQQRLDDVKKSTETLSERLDKAREENDDLRFQLEERNIELEGTRARVRVLERLQQRPPTEADPEADAEHPRCEQSGLEPGSSTESARDHHQALEVKPSPRRRPSRIPLPGAAAKSAAPRPPSHGRNDSRESLKSLTRAPRDSSRDSHCGKSLSKPRDTSRESIGSKSLSRTSNGSAVGNAASNNTSNGSGSGNSRETNRESLNKSLPRNNSSRDSLNKSSSLSRARDSLESSNLGTSPSPGTAPSRRPPAPARRSHSLARAASSVDTDNGKSLTDPPSSWCSKNSSFRHSDTSLYPDSLNQETSSITGSTRVEFIIGSPTRRFRTAAPWQNRYFDSIDSAAIAPESLITDEFPPRSGEALAEYDSLQCNAISNES